MNYLRRSTAFNLAMVFFSTTTTLGSAQLLTPSYCTDSASTQSGVIETIHWEPACLLQECQGDCDSDNDCDGNLICFQREDDGTPVPGCTGEPKDDYDYCSRCGSNSGVLENIGGNPVCPLQRCAGDCDSDDDCDGNLICFQRDYDGPSIPGCNGEPKRDFDYCYNCGSNSGVLENIGVNPACPLQRCAGDCDSDDDCDGNLFCFQRDDDGSSVPGCIGEPNGLYDYCYSCGSNSGVLENIEGNPVCPLQECAGDCDSDDDCDGNLFCFQGEDDDSPVPGCIGEPNGEYHYCYSCGSNSGVLENIGDNPACPLQECAGDCDSDDDCDGKLLCFQRDSTNPVVPGCIGTPHRDWDYCINVLEALSIMSARMNLLEDENVNYRTRITELEEVVLPPSWTHVRHVPSGNKWHPAVDSLDGTDTYSIDFENGIAWSKNFESEAPNYNEFLFRTGDKVKWLVASKSSVMGWYENEYRIVLRSSINPQPHIVKWYRRKEYPEDPWISLTNHHLAIADGNIIYGEASIDDSGNVLSQHDGADVYIRANPKFLD